MEVTGYEPGASQPLPQPSTSGQQPRRLTIPRPDIPLHLLVATHDPDRHPPGVLSSRDSIRRSMQDQSWARSREHLLAAAAAGVHVALFAYNLAFWGLEGMPPDRYWPANPRIRLGLRGGRYGNLEGSKKVWYNYMWRWLQ